ncbi:MAG: hypothetical protein AAF962_25465 [Actinomycetota bacterium]
MQQFLPRAVVVLGVLHALAAIVFGSLAHIDSTNQFPDLVTNDDGLFAVGLYANRNLGVGLALLAALAVRSRLAVVGLFLARFITDLADFVVALADLDGAGALVRQLIFSGLLFASEIYMIRALLRLERSEAASL